MPKVDELRRKWAVEQAIKWPVVARGNGGGMMGGGMGTTYDDADVIGRAEKLLRFLTGKAQQQ